nr:uncharacterized protein LOC117988626 isoform X2 [Maniola hyperantus]
MEQTVDVVDFISSLLDSGKYKEALTVPIEDKYANSFKDNCWDLISVIVGKIQNETMVIKPSLYSACEELLAIIVQSATPEEALLEFIEQIEVAKNDAQFAIILEPLQQLLLKLSAKRGRSLEWCLNSIATYIDAIPIPEHKLEGQERLLMDSDPNIRRIIKVYSLLPPFYSPFVIEMAAVDAKLRTKEIISAFLISLLAMRNSCRLFIPLRLTTSALNNTQKILRSYCQGVKKEVVVPATIDQDDHQYEEDVKKRILAKALDFVAKSSWSVESLAQGAEAAGYPGVSHGLFPNGGGDLVHYFNITCNEKLVEEMKSWPKEELKESKVPAQQIENAIMTRLLMIEPFKSTWPKAMAIQTLPNNVPNCLATLLSLVDDICYHTGDRSVDFNWYIRRVGLAGIYKASELFYLTDSSQNSNATRSFVKSRIRDAELIQIALNMNPVTVAPQTLTAAFVTAKNMLGINSLK